MLAMMAAAALLAACSEIPQDARKPFAGAQETKAAAASLDSRAAVQDEYARVGGAKK
jgi:starvation-inducible outer membrane lipoprotein